jgi:hypothetical protein
MRVLRCLGITSFTLAVLAGTARADDDAFSDTARELFQKGMKAYDQQKWEQCRAALLAAFAIKRHSQIAGNLAECELHVGAYRDAAEHAWFFAHTLRPDAAPERRAMAETALRETQKRVGAVVITVDVDDADVLVDGKSAGKTPLGAPVFVEPGRHTIEALHTGDPGASATVDAGAGETREVALSVKKKETRPPPPPPVVVVQRRPLWPVIAGGSVTLVALGVGAGLTVAANHKTSDANAALAMLTAPPGANVCQMYTSACATINTERQAHDALAKGTIGAFVGAGAIGVATLGYALAALKGSPRTSVIPVLGAHDAGVSIVRVW